MKKIIAGLLVFALVFSLAACGDNSGDGQKPEEKSSPDDSQDTARAAVIDDFTGEVSAVLDDGDMPAFKGLSLLRKNSLATGAESWSSLELNEGQFAMVSENSVVQVAQLADDAKSAELYVQDGKIWVSIKKMLSDDESFVVNTPSCSLSVRGTVFSVEASGKGDTRLAVLDGTVSLKAQDENGNPILDESGNEVVLSVSEGAAEITIENGMVTKANETELTAEDLEPFCLTGSDGPGGLFKTLRDRLPDLIWEASLSDSGNGGYYYSWTGTWEVAGSWGIMELIQNGSDVIGSYAHEDGEISGIVSRDKWAGTWTQPGNNRNGTFEAVMSSDGKSIEIKWKYDGDADWYATDSGTRRTPLPKGRISLDAAVYTPGAQITVSVADITEQMSAAGAFVRIYKTGEPHDNGRIYDDESVRAADSEAKITAPGETGEDYEVRLYSSWGTVNEETFVMSVPFTVEKATQGNISLDAAAYTPGAQITVAVTDITEQMKTAGAFVRIYKTGEPHDNGRVYDDTSVAAGDSEVTITAPGETGDDYEVRLYGSWWNVTDDTYIMSVPFTLEKATQGNISLDSATYTPGSRITVAVTDITEQMATAGAFVRVYKKGEPHDNGRVYDDTSVAAGDSEVTITAPGETGDDYEVRLYGSWWNVTDDTYIMSVPFAVKKATQGNISLDSSAYTPGSRITAAVTDITEQMETAGAFVRVYKKGEPHDNGRVYDDESVRAGDSEVTITAPGETGDDYEVRLYGSWWNVTDDTFIMSVPFAVEKVTQGNISLDAAAYTPKAQITVTVTDITEQMEAAGAFVRIYKKGDPHDNGRVYDDESVRAGDGEATITAPDEKGEYEARLYGSWWNLNDDTFVKSVPFKVR